MNENLKKIQTNISAQLSSLLAVLELLEGTSMTGEQAAYVDMIRISADNINSYAQRLEEENLKSKGVMPDVEEQVFDLRILVHDVAAQFEDRAQHKNFTFSLAITDDVPSLVFSCPSALRKLLLDCLERVVSAPDSCQVNLCVRLDSKNVSDARIRIQVSVNHVFEGMQETAKISDPKCPPNIIFHSADLIGRKTIFWTTSVIRESKSRNLTLPQPISIHGSKILVIDHDKNWHSVMREYCRQWNCVYEESLDERDASRKIEEAIAAGTNFDFVLMNSNADDLPAMRIFNKMQGKSDPANPSFVMLTSSPKPGDAKLMKRFGFSGYLTKPVKIQQLFDTLCLIKGLKKNSPDNTLVTRYTVTEERKRRKVILIVTNFIAESNKLISLLAKSGYSYDIASNFENASKNISENIYSLIVIVTNKKIISDTELIQSFCASNESIRSQTIPVIGLIESTDQSLKINEIDFDVAGFLNIPEDISELSTIIETYASSECSLCEEEDSLILDKQSLMDQLDQDPVLFAEVIESFVTEGEARLREYQDALDASDYELARQKAFALRGVAGNIRAERVRIVAEMAEHACAIGHRDKAAALYSDILAELNKVSSISLANAK